MFKLKKIVGIVLLSLFWFVFPSFLVAQTESKEKSPDEPKSQTESPSLTDLGLQAQIYRRIGQDYSVPKLITNLGAMKNYPLTPGDIYTLSIKRGSLNNIDDKLPINFEIQLLDDYTIELPLIGTINCKGKNFPQLQKEVIRKIKSSFSVFYVNLTFNQPAQFTVFVYGAVKNPGRIQANPLLTLSQAIGEKGGFISNASYRQIQLKRNGEIKTIDLSQYYSYADESQNPYLQPNDEIFIPQAKKMVYVAGKVHNPGIYEVLEKESVHDILAYTGGLTNEAATDNYEIERIINFRGERQYINHSLLKSKEQIPENGDKIYIRSILENASMLTIDGAVYGQRSAKLYPEAAPTHPYRINLPYTEGTTILSLLESVGGPTPYAITNRAFIKRRGSITQEPFNLQKLWETREKQFDMQLYPGDTVVIPIQILKIFVAGEVNKPGAFDFSSSFRPIDYIMMAGGFSNSANMTTLFTVDAKGTPQKISFDKDLEPGTILYIKKNHATEVGKAFENVTVYTSFINTILGTINSGLYFYRQLQDSNILNR